jgi:hypothetical protein
MEQEEFRLKKRKKSRAKEEVPYKAILHALFKKSRYYQKRQQVFRVTCTKKIVDLQGNTNGILTRLIWTIFPPIDLIGKMFNCFNFLINLISHAAFSMQIAHDENH